MSSKIEPQYLGDGVYASFDGWYVWLTTGSHKREEADSQIALEPNVFKNLISFYETNLAPQQTIDGDEIFIVHGRSAPKQSGSSIEHHQYD